MKWWIKVKGTGGNSCSVVVVDNPVYRIDLADDYWKMAAGKPKAVGRNGHGEWSHVPAVKRVVLNEKRIGGGTHSVLVLDGLMLRTARVGATGNGVHLTKGRPIKDGPIMWEVTHIT